MSVDGIDFYFLLVPQGVRFVSYVLKTDSEKRNGVNSLVLLGCWLRENPLFCIVGKSLWDSEVQEQVPRVHKHISKLSSFGVTNGAGMGSIRSQCKG